MTASSKSASPTGHRSPITIDLAASPCVVTPTRVAPLGLIALPHLWELTHQRPGAQSPGGVLAR